MAGPPTGLGAARELPAIAAGQKPPRPPRTENRSGRVALLFLAPTLVLLAIFLVYPTIYTFFLSFNRGRQGNFTQWVGLDNYIQLFTKDPNFLDLRHFPPSGALFNNVLWLIFYTSIVIFLGLVIAVMASRVRYESLIKAVVFLPQAIAATALAVIFTFVFNPDPTLGVLNAILGIVNIGPISWLGDPGFVNASLIAVGIWGSVGFATVILSAAIKSISSEVLEAARVDGANEWQVFRRIILPLLMPTIFVVGTTIVITALKSFDIVFTVTNGNFGTDVIAREMWQQMFTPPGNFGRASAVAIVLLLAIIPFMAVNVRRFREQEAIR